MYSETHQDTLFLAQLSNFSFIIVSLSPSFQTAQESLRHHIGMSPYMVDGDSTSAACSHRKLGFSFFDCTSSHGSQPFQHVLNKVGTLPLDFSGVATPGQRPQ